MIKDLKKRFIYFLLRLLGVPGKPATSWENHPDWIRYFEVLSYPKEGWINTFHNYDDLGKLKEDLKWVFANNMFGPAIGKGKWPKTFSQIKNSKRILKKGKVYGNYPDTQ